MSDDTVAAQEIYLSRPRIARVRRDLDAPLDEHLRREGDRALQTQAFTVMDKSLVPPSGDKHDFLRMPTYAWPNPDTPDGLPYIIRDGEFGPHIHGPDYDQGRMSDFTRAVRSLAWAFLATGDEAYSRHAVALLRVWFLDPATRMNPNLTYSKYTPGMAPPYPTGVIATHTWAELVQALGLLEAYDGWAEIAPGLRRWFTDYIDWLQSSDQGREERGLGNNRGIWYDAQLVAFARFVGDDALARQVLRDSVPRRLDTQLAADGSLPAELRRTNGLGYSLMTLRAYALVALAGDLLGIDLWRHRTGDGRHLRRAFDYLGPYLLHPEDWPHQQIKPAGLGTAVLPWLAAADAYGDADMRSCIAAAAAPEVRRDPARLLFAA